MLYTFYLLQLLHFAEGMILFIFWSILENKNKLRLKYKNKNKNEKRTQKINENSFNPICYPPQI